jgi:hypothetical protein
MGNGRTLGARVLATVKNEEKTKAALQEREILFDWHNL